MVCKNPVCFQLTVIYLKGYEFTLRETGLPLTDKNSYKKTKAIGWFQATFDKKLWFQFNYFYHFEISLICKMYGFSTGTIIKPGEYNSVYDYIKLSKGENIMETINCKNNATNITDCKVVGKKLTKNVFERINYLIECSDDINNLVCQKGLSIFDTCYYFYHMTNKYSVNDKDKFCKLKNLSSLTYPTMENYFVILYLYFVEFKNAIDPIYIPESFTLSIKTNIDKQVNYILFVRLSF